MTETLVPKDEILGANTIAASLFFAKVFGTGSAARGLNILILLSAFGNLVSPELITLIILLESECVSEIVTCNEDEDNKLT